MSLLLAGSVRAETTENKIVRVARPSGSQITATTYKEKSASPAGQNAAQLAALQEAGNESLPATDALNTLSCNRTASLLKSASARRGQDAPTTTDPVTYLAFRAGAMVTPRGPALVGLDASFPRLSIGRGWHGRLDVDVIIKANFAGTDTVVPITFDQIYYRNTTGNNDVYGGFGLGAILGAGDALFDGKLILGTTLGRRFSAEVNINFTDNDTLVMLLGRARL